MESADQHAGDVQISASPATPESAPRKRMSTGAKWAIGLGIAFLLFMLGSCALMAVMLGDTDSLSLSSGDGVAVIYIDDAIAGTTGVTPESILSQLDQARDDDSVKAIILRIDSPGGTVAASQEIMMAVRRVSEEKPIITSVGDMCASGAYMVASQTDEIITAPGSVVGSIGVIMELVNAEGLLDKVGLKFTTLTQGEYKDAGSMYRSLTETETAMLNEQMASIQKQFVADVAEGRDMSIEEAGELAIGWAWLGSEALELDLIDSIGNYDDAIDRAAELGGIEGEPRIVTYASSDPFADLYLDVLGLLSPRGDIDAEALRRMSLPR
ncbi:MAG: signal peptide peptidase SppA [Coriobacteriia bacterium]|nr:signal peptide peptidase SppA [Coriobacteriia bacterium]